MKTVISIDKDLQEATLWGEMMARSMMELAKAKGWDRDFDVKLKPPSFSLDANDE